MHTHKNSAPAAVTAEALETDNPGGESQRLQHSTAGSVGLASCPDCAGAIVTTCVHGDEVDRAFRALADLPSAKERAAARKAHRDLPDSGQEAEEGEAYDAAGALHKISGRTVRRLEKIAQLAPEKLDDIRAKKVSIARAYLDIRNQFGDHGSEADSDTYLTPRHIIEAIVEHVGPIDLDPCTTTKNWVEAKHFYALQRGQDGLQLPWHEIDEKQISTIYLNPPYNNGACLPWMQRSHRVSTEHGVKIVLLVPATMGSEHAQYALEHATTIHYLRDRPHFLDIHERDTGSPPFDCMLVGFNCDLRGIALPGVTR